MILFLLLVFFIYLIYLPNRTHKLNMKLNRLHVISALVGEYSLLIPASYILEITIPSKQIIGQIDKNNKPQTVYWKQYNIPLLVFNNGKHSISHLIILRALFSNTYKCYALACCTIPKMIKLNPKDINNTVTNTDNSNIKYRTTIGDKFFLIADFKNIETMLEQPYRNKSYYYA